MVVIKLKSAALTADASADSSSVRSVRERVEEMLGKLMAGRERAALEYARDIDGWSGGDGVLLSAEQIETSVAKVPEQLMRDIDFAHANVKRFAEAQKRSCQDFEIEVIPGLIAGQKSIAVGAAGCYVPGGRYAHIASAIMTCTTAKVAGVGHITACSPPSGPGGTIPPAIIYAMKACGVDTILAMGGVQAVAAMAYGMFGLPKADVLAGPGNQYVAEAKRLLYGECGIDMIAGPTDSLIIADETADADTVAIDLIGQAEHGYNSPVWLVTTSRTLGEAVLARAPALIDGLPKLNGDNARLAWRDHAEVILCETAEEMAAVADEVAPEHLSVQAKDLDWWLGRLRSYGSLFLGEETTVPFGDKCSGPNHCLPTSGAARYTGGLSVHKFLKLTTWQRCSREASKSLALTTCRISRSEGMEGHAQSAEIRLSKFFPGESFAVAAPSAP